MGERGVGQDLNNKQKKHTKLLILSPFLKKRMGYPPLLRPQMMMMMTLKKKEWGGRGVGKN